VLDSQTDTSDSIRAWAAHFATVTGELKTQDPAVSKLLTDGPGAADETRALVDRLQTVGCRSCLNNLVGLDDVGITYRNRPRATPRPAPRRHLHPAGRRSGQQRYQNRLTRAGYLSFNLNLNLPPACVTGFPAGPSSNGFPPMWTIRPRPGRRPVLPGSPGRAVQCPWRPQHPV